MSIYTPEMAKAMRKLKKPFTFTMDIAEHEAGLSILVYESEVLPMNDSDRFKLMKYLTEVGYLLESFGPQVSIEGVKGAPQRLR